jgi:glycosyltransferase involved in cell wall biosynthesis
MAGKGGERCRPAFSVIVPTHNRIGVLPNCLEHVVKQEYPPEDFEIVVVDNGCTDGTAEFLDRLRAGRPDRPAIRVVREERLGASVARNAGIAAALGQVLAFTEDDAWPHPGWLAAYDRAFARADVWSAGGPIELVFTSPVPSWCSPPLYPYLGAFDRGGRDEAMTYNEYPRGGNMAFRQRAFEEAGTFSPRFGRLGRSLRTGEEIEMGWRLEQRGRAIVYVPDALVYHRIDADRLDRAWFLERFAWQGRSEAHFDRLHRGWSEIKRRIAQEWRELRHRPTASMTEAERFYRECRRRTARGYLVGLSGL